MLIGAFGILCGFALVVFAAASRPGVPAIAVAAAAAALSWIALPARSLPDPVWGALAVLAFATLMLWRPERKLLASVGAGVAAAVWLALLAGQGLPVPFALPIVLALAAAVFWLARRSSRFAPATLVEEALLICALFAIVIACWPAVSAGYRSALVFTAERVSVPAAARAPWALQLSVGLLVLGGLYGVWKRR